MRYPLSFALVNNDKASFQILISSITESNDQSFKALVVFCTGLVSHIIVFFLFSKNDIKIDVHRFLKKSDVQSVYLWRAEYV